MDDVFVALAKENKSYMGTVDGMDPLIRGCHEILVAVEGKWMVHAHDEHILVVVLREEHGCIAILRKDMDHACRP